MHPDVLVYDESFVIWHTREVEARTALKSHLLLVREVEEARMLTCKEGGHRHRELCLPAREVEDVGSITKMPQRSTSGSFLHAREVEE